MRSVVIDSIRGWRRLLRGCGCLTGVQIPVEARKVAAADLEP
jgi:hypothetical protein